MGRLNRKPVLIMSTVQLHAALRKHDSDRLILNEHDGSLWVSNSYWLLRCGENSPFEALLDEYNLPFEPMVCDVGRTVKRTDRPPADIAPLLTGAMTWKVAKREELGGMPVLVESAGKLAQVWKVGKSSATLTDEYVKFVERLTPLGEWRGQDALRPFARCTDDRVEGLLMPIRTLLSAREAA